MITVSPFLECKLSNINIFTRMVKLIILLTDICGSSILRSLDKAPPINLESNSTRQEVKKKSWIL